MNEESLPPKNLPESDAESLSQEKSLLRPPSRLGTYRPSRLVAQSQSFTPEQRIEALESESLKLSLLLETSRFYSSERELVTLMARVTQQTTLIMDCERTSVFLLDRKKNELYSLFAQGLDVEELRFTTSRGLAGYSATQHAIVNIPNAYKDPRFNPDVDKATGYHTVSILCVPMQNRRGEVLGVIQCLNKRGQDMDIGVFTPEDEALLTAVGSQAQFYLENTSLYHEMDRLFEAFVEATSRSIDDRDPCTSGHSRRVMLYSLNLARAVHESPDAPFDKINYNRNRFRQLRYACLLHDVGKIGVREHILAKSHKLQPSNLNSIQHRFLYLQERKRADCLMDAITQSKAPEEILAKLYQPFCVELNQAFAKIEAANAAGFTNDADIATLKEYRLNDWITQLEFEHLSIQRGNLTESEWVDMRSHVTKSFRMLQQIPWPTELKDLSEVAYSHHEKRDGSGYPRKLQGDAIHFDGQIMCVADIFDALTASDRPYKKAMPFERARKILFEEEAGRGRILPELIQLFFDKKCYEIDKTSLHDTNLIAKPEAN
jgi:HD-GYP domain-containing protein (c-di-GMP phosphodiesterase class II)